MIGVLNEQIALVTGTAAARVEKTTAAIANIKRFMNQ